MSRRRKIDRLLEDEHWLATALGQVRFIANTREFSPAAIAVLYQLALRERGTGVAFPSEKTLANDCGFGDKPDKGDRTARRALHDLREGKVIEREPWKKGQRTPHYRTRMTDWITDYQEAALANLATLPGQFGHHAYLASLATLPGQFGHQSVKETTTNRKSKRAPSAPSSSSNGSCRFCTETDHEGWEPLDESWVPCECGQALGPNAKPEPSRAPTHDDELGYLRAKHHERGETLNGD